MPNGNELDWGELVTTALLGTDRRPVVTTSGLLDEAARHRASSRSAPPLARCPAPPRAPELERPEAPVPAQELLDGLLGRPVAELVNGWLAAAVAAQVLAAPRHWAALAALAANRPDYDRRLLALALGRAGSWFLDQNPAWSRLAESVRRTLAQPPTEAEPGPNDDGSNRAWADASVVPGEAEVRARPEAALAVAAPWPRPLTVAALRVVLSGQLGWRAATYGSAVGARMAVADADLLQQATEAPGIVDGRGAPPGARLVQDAVAAATRSVQARVEIARSFTPSSQEPDEHA